MPGWTQISEARCCRYSHDRGERLGARHLLQARSGCGLSRGDQQLGPDLADSATAIVGSPIRSTTNQLCLAQPRVGMYLRSNLPVASGSLYSRGASRHEKDDKRDRVPVRLGVVLNVVGTQVLYRWWKEATFDVTQPESVRKSAKMEEQVGKDEQRRTRPMPCTMKCRGNNSGFH